MMPGRTKPWENDALASNGTPIKENFQAWFAQSKVVDVRGNPLVVFHGTHEDVAHFDSQCIGNSFSADEQGFFFTSLPSIADFYATFSFGGETRRDGPNIMPCFVSLQRPLVVNAAFLAKENMAPIGMKDDSIGFWDNYQGLILQWVVEKRADGVILVDELTRVKGLHEPIRTIVAFKPEQIKSAVGNSGLYLGGGDSLTDHPDALRLRQAAKARAAAIGQRALEMAP